MKRLEKIETVLSVVSNGGIVAFGVSIDSNADRG